jgi:hypothetical protein
LPNAQGKLATAYDFYVYNGYYIGGSLCEVVSGTGSWTGTAAVSTDPGAAAFTVPLQYTIQSNLKVDTTVFINNATARVGIGIDAPGGKLHVNSSNLDLAQFTKSGIPYTEGTLNIGNLTAVEPNFIPLIRGRSSATKPLGLYLVGETNDIAPDGEIGAGIVLDGRPKTGGRLLNNNILTIASSAIPLVTVKANGALCLSTTDPKGYLLAVNGSGIFTKVVVKNNANWPDYVFDTKYTLPPLAEVEKYISENSKLPDLPSAAEINNKGQDIGEVNRLLVQKVEELTLYIIKMNKRIEELEQKNK